MEGNKDDALRCLKIGKEALEIGNKTRALKFISKARRLDPSLDIDDLLSTLGGESSNPTASDTSAAPSDEASSSSKPKGIPSLRPRVTLSSSGVSSEPLQKAYTDEQIAIVRQIKKKKDYYEILGVEKSCSVDDVRKAYRKLSLKVHPDKNTAPGAEEAFKSVSKAFQCLSDEENRKKYDVSGSDEVVYDRRATSRRGPQGFNGFYDGDVDAEEIFRNFFYGAGPRATTQFGGFTFSTGMGPSVRTRNTGSGDETINYRALLQLLPILLVILLQFIPSSQPIYSLSRSYPYEYRVTTPKGVNYYVMTTTFEQEYPAYSSGRTALEQRIEREYFSALAQNCQVEMQRRQWGFTRETPHCDMLKKFETMA
ncbi:hypothetical protein GIB67_021390 [Kingdonia uniflora]|uniref:J domain-containing protein n=1 Tax=Kingdonia uniflora TaxID=39325 RepID=A0A7J7MD76_9MAGN|nr:hypothetical protein GIB67_021390 [Kingdonia uniflora]